MRLKSIQIASNDLIVSGMLLVLHWVSIHSKASFGPLEQTIYFSLLSFGILCAIVSGSRRFFGLTFLLVSSTVIAAEVVTPAQDLLMVRAMGAAVGAGMATFVLRRDRKWWEFGIVYLLSWGLGMVAHQVPMDAFEWNETKPSYQMVSACFAAAVGLTVFPTIVKALQNRISQIGGINANAD